MQTVIIKDSEAPLPNLAEEGASAVLTILDGETFFIRKNRRGLAGGPGHPLRELGLFVAEAFGNGAPTPQPKTPEQIEQIAIVCHQANQAYCGTLGDFTQAAWHDAPEWQRETCRKGVAFHLAHPEATAAASHESWLEEKRATGWSYGPVKDPEKKTHPCFVPFEALPPEQQAKDRIFKAIVDALR